MAHILVSGGSSYLGQHLVPAAERVHKVNYTFFRNDPLGFTSGHQLDIREKADVLRLVAALRPDAIIHTVGSNRGADMSQVIIKGTEHVTQAAQEAGARLIHISTDVVFDGKNPPYKESAVPSPMHEYGRAKAEAETIVRSHENHVIIRTSLIYGLHIMDRGTEWIIEELQAGRPVTLFIDQRRNPVWAETLSQACLELAVLDYRGNLNVAGTQELTRAEFGRRMLDWWQIKERNRLAYGPSDGEKWPKDCTFDLRRASQILTTSLPGVDDVLTKNAGKRNP